MPAPCKVGGLNSDAGALSLDKSAWFRLFTNDMEYRKQINKRTFVDRSCFARCQTNMCNHYPLSEIKESQRPAALATRNQT